MSVHSEPTYHPADLADALERVVLALLRTPPIRQALHDILQIYGLSGQFREVLASQHDQIVAIAGILTLLYARLIEHDKRAIEIGKHTLIIMQRQAARMQAQDDLPDSILQAATDAIARVHAESLAQVALIDAEAAEVRALLLRTRAAAAHVGEMDGTP